MDTTIEQNSPRRSELIITGLGGSGILTIGALLAEAAIAQYENVTWFPSYAISKRGGLCECTVIFSDNEIASPLLTRSNVIIVAESAQFKDFESRVRPGGIIIVEKTGLQAKTEINDISIIEVPAIETAINLTGTSQNANFVLLGAFVKATEAISPEIILQQISKSFAGKGKVIKNNRRAFETGYNSIIRK